MDSIRKISMFPLLRFLSSEDHGMPTGYDHLVIIGNGAVKNGWEPVLKTLREHGWRSSEFQSPLFKKPTQFNAAHCLSIISFVFRMLRNAFFKDPSRIDFLSVIQEINEFKEELCKNFKEAEKEKSISLRSDLAEIIKKIGINNSSLNTGYITLNWDELLWSRCEEFPNLIQLHGRVGLPYSLIFPTELSIDENIIEVLQKKKVYDISSEQHRMLGKNNIYSELSRNHYWALNWFENVKKLFIWGVNFNEYDCELNSILFVMKNVSLNEIYVLDTQCSNRVDFLSKIMNFDITKFKCIQVNDL
ncbi:hypothetical protein CH352_18760 [Leptospira hartskeerlii]|uniref:SIR2-like domain-containing protein n=1 Tax=Leptospira hartskeerlii TaxID=2023177 RepID=A0A2M9X8P7_9LEPT|nr:hypothetical protein [Leptospira hartskeerlii]PJZ23922.1 hypothetical protein CH357_18685 [Leptospira hartskeerlii]PJZ31949.1 hypothetical protein CH352_18760 [Leptospira hartskeerlii]